MPSSNCFISVGLAVSTTFSKTTYSEVVCAIANSGNTSINKITFFIIFKIYACVNRQVSNNSVSFLIQNICKFAAKGCTVLKFPLPIEKLYPSPVRPFDFDK